MHGAVLSKRKYKNQTVDILPNQSILDMKQMVFQNQLII